VGAAPNARTETEEDELEGWAPKIPLLAETAMKNDDRRTDKNATCWRTPPLVIYEGNFVSPPARILRSPASVYEVNCLLAYRTVPSDQLIDEFLTELYDRHKGRLIDYDGKEVDRDKEDLALLFGEDAGRYIRDRRDKTDGPRKNRLPMRLVRREMIILAALEIEIWRNFEPE